MANGWGEDAKRLLWGRAPDRGHHLYAPSAQTSCLKPRIFVTFGWLRLLSLLLHAAAASLSLCNQHIRVDVNVLPLYVGASVRKWGGFLSVAATIAVPSCGVWADTPAAAFAEQADCNRVSCSRSRESSSPPSAVDASCAPCKEELILRDTLVLKALQKQRPCVLSGFPLKLLGAPTPTVPHSHPYLAQAIPAALPGPFARLSAPIHTNSSPSTLRNLNPQGLEAFHTLQLVSTPARPSATGSPSACTYAPSPASARACPLPYTRGPCSCSSCASAASSPQSDEHTLHKHHNPDTEDGGENAIGAARLQTLSLSRAALPRIPTKAGNIPGSSSIRNPFPSWMPVEEETPRVCISSASGDISQEHFGEKAVRVLGCDSLLTLESLGVSVVCRKGFKQNSPNNDAFFVSQRRPEIGDQEGELTALLLRRPSVFRQAHSELARTCKARRIDSELSGATVTVAVYLRKQQRLVVAHVGNSRHGLRAVELTADHLPTNKGERRRITRAGGEVRLPDGDGVHRVFFTNMNVPGLGIARAIGDTLACGVGVTAVPDVKEFRINPKRDAFLLVCSDGVWDVMSSQEAVDAVASAEAWQSAPEAVACESWRRWIDRELIFADDITALCLRFSRGVQT
ncbi:protein phosphatase [Cyclospora cayetanensis]|uniref:Protein phosphatase n=1 Tax=Cyclospora cayetanensis TaxID=88456 RepID=A0A1D3CYJ9_9EIME|nr:protein phosphatase [Cyclospora cayetanensis]